MKPRRQMHAKVYAMLIAGFLCAFGASAAAERVQDLPKPTDYVSDYAHALSSEATARLDHICGELDHSRANAQVEILTVHSLDGDNAADYANQVEDLWRIGKKGSDRGVLILLAVDDRKYRIDVGYGLEAILPDGRLGDFGRWMVPYLRDKDYDGAIELVVGQLAKVITADAGTTLDDPPVVPRRRWPLGQTIFVTFALLFFFVPVFLRIGWEIGAFIGLWKRPFPWRGRSGNVEPSFRGEDRSSSGGDSGKGGGSSDGFSGSGGGEFGGGGAGGSW